VDSSALTSILRSVPSVPTLAMRRAVLERHLSGLAPEEAAALLEELCAAAGHPGAHSAAVSLASLIAHRRKSGDSHMLDAIAAAASEAGLALAASLSSDSAAPKSIRARGRLPEVGLNREAYFPTVLPPEVGSGWGQADCTIFRRFAEMGLTWFGPELKPTGPLLQHPSGAFLERLLRSRWIRQRDVLTVAARRPSTPEIAITVATDDRWFSDPRVRSALAENPFTPSWLAAAIRLTTPLGSARRRSPVPLHGVGGVQVGLRSENEVKRASAQ